VSFLDDFSRYTWLFPIACKSDVYTIFNQFKLYVERYFSCSIKSVQSDWGGEYRSLSKILQHHGITHRLSCPHTHQQNGAIERKHRHIVETSLALLSFASVPRQYWDDAFVTACYLINRMPTPLLKNQSPFELLFKTPPDYKILHIFGCACWPHLRPYNSNKLQPRSLQCVFLGYSLRHKGYKCLHLPTGRVYFSRDVLFQEDIFPFATTPSHSSPPTVNSPPTHPREPSIILPPTAPTHPRATVQPVSSAAPHTPCVIQPPSPFHAPPHTDNSSSRATHSSSSSPSHVPSLPTLPDSPSPVAPSSSNTVSPLGAPNLQVSHHPMTT
jgi:hypothetical protein